MEGGRDLPCGIPGTLIDVTLVFLDIATSVSSFGWGRSLNQINCFGYGATGSRGEATIKRITKANEPWRIQTPFLQQQKKLNKTHTFLGIYSFKLKDILGLSVLEFRDFCPYDKQHSLKFCRYQDRTSSLGHCGIGESHLALWQVVHLYEHPVSGDWLWPITNIRTAAAAASLLARPNIASAPDPVRPRPTKNHLLP